MKQKVIVVLGPTAVGKTKLSIELAKYLHTEIISGDSAQVYRRMDIGTSKVTEDEKEGIKHHLIDMKEPGEAFSVAEFQQLVRGKIAEINARGMIPIIAGGTGLYIRSVLYDYQFIDQERDESFKDQYAEYSNEALHELLKQVDPNSAEVIHPNNRRRVLRALEIYYSSDQQKSDLQLNDEKELLYDALIIGLDLEREKLYERINKRVDTMVQLGLLEEAKSLFDEGHRLNIIGYKELNDYFTGFRSLESCLDAIKKDTRHLAKRQLTFFRNQFDVNWFQVNLENYDQTVQDVKALVNSWRK
jgi:tRNA dimethylallyltransferase